MAALSADLPIRFDPRWEIGATQYVAVTADIYYRGGLAHFTAADSTLNLTPNAADNYAGVVLEHKSAATSDLVWIATSGRWFFTCANFTIANLMATFAQQAGVLFDNPADLDISGVGDAGAIGRLWLVGTTATDGWIDTSDRAALTNA